MDSDALAALLTTPIITIGGHAIPVSALVLAGLLLLFFLLWLRARSATREALELAESREAESSDRLDAVLKSQ